MPDTSGPTSRTPFAHYDPDSCSWRTSQGTFPWDSGTFSETWPKRGMTRSGAAFELPTSAHLTDANASSSLLPTPAAQEPGGTVEQYHERLRKADGREPTFTPLGMLVESLLPTPRTTDSHGAAEHGEGGQQLNWVVMCSGAITSPPSTDGKPLPDPHPRRPTRKAGSRPGSSNG